MSRAPVRTVLLLGGLTALGPIGTDLYLSALPTIARSQHVSISAVQLTLTTFMIGLGAGQLIAGPLSDRLGRRPPLYVGLVVYIVASLCCAIAPSVGVLALARVLQGAAGGACMVISRALVRDMFEGPVIVAVLARLMLVVGVTPVLAPLCGSLLLNVTSWRGLFGIMAALALALLAPTMRALAARGERGSMLAAGRPAAGRAPPIPESWPATIRALAVGPFMPAAVCGGLAVGTLFAFISGSSFAFEDQFGLSHTAFGLLYALVAAALVASSQASAALARRWGAPAVLLTATVVGAVAGLVLVADMLAGAGLLIVVPALMVVTASLGLIMPTATAIALMGQRERAGTASAILGVLQAATAAAVAPVVGAFGVRDAVPMAVSMAVCLSGACAFALVAERMSKPSALPGQLSLPG